MDPSSGSLEPLDQVLYSGLQDSRNRQLILKVESSIITFLESKQARLEFPPLGSYQRLVVHQVAEYYALAHATALPTGPDNGKRVIQLARTPQTQLAPVKLKDRDDWNAHKVPQASPVEANQKVAIAKPQGPRRGVTSRDSGPANTLTLEEREEAYAAARARIMGASGDEAPAAAPSAQLENSSAELSAPGETLPVKAELRPEAAMFDPDYCRNSFNPQHQEFVAKSWGVGLGHQGSAYGTVVAAQEHMAAANTWQAVQRPMATGWQHSGWHQDAPAAGWQPTLNSGGWQGHSGWQQPWQQPPQQPPPSGAHTQHGWGAEPVLQPAVSDPPPPPPPPPPQEPPNLWGEQFPPLPNQDI